MPYKRIYLNTQILFPGILEYIERARKMGITSMYTVARLLEFGAMADPLGIGAPPTREELAKREAAEKAKAEAAQKEARIQRIKEIKLEVFKSGEANPLPGETHEEGETRIKAIIKARLAAEGILEE